MLKFLKENWFLILAIIYVFSPIDLIPEFVPIFGSFDDGGILLVELIRRISGKPKKAISQTEKKLISDSNE